MYLPVDWPVADLVSRRAEATPDRLAIIAAETGEAWTYRELSVGPVAELAAGITEVRIPAGGHVGALLEPGVRLAQLRYAAARAGVVFVPLSPDAPAGVLAERCSVADIDALVCGGGTERAAIQAFDGPVYTADVAGSGGVDSLATHRAESPPSHRWDRNEVQWLVFTSGTVGEPRAVKLTAGNLLASATASAYRLGVQPDDRWLACLPMHHVGGLAPFVRSALYGTAVVVQSGFEAGAAAGIMAEYDVTGISLVPTMLRRLLDTGWTPTGSLRYVLLGGAAAPRSLIDRCRDAAIPVHPTYGMTETASQVATARPQDAFAHPGTVGRPLHGIELRVHTDKDDPAPPGEPGEVVVAGQMVSPGYYGDVEATADRFDGGSFRTRDRGYRDDAGRLWVVGRLDATIVTGGETVQPAGVETTLQAHPGVEAAVVVGLPDSEWGEVVGALVETSESAHVDESVLRDYSRERLEPAAVPKVIGFADEFPRTASGTIDRGAVRDRLQAVDRADGL